MNKAPSNAIQLSVIAVGVMAAIALAILVIFVISRQTDQPQAGNPNGSAATRSAESQKNNLSPDISEDDVKNKLPESRTLRERRIAELQAALEKLSSTQRGDNRPARKRLKTFESLTGEQKNLLWWKIASVASTKQGGGTRYQLTTRQAMQISSEVGSSDLDVFKLFREGVDADWRTPTPPPEITEESETGKAKS